ncbi:MAG TPA: glycosyltransferase family 39 protein [Rhizomicrobium sp.]|nr:glycosyltransferase family 39 protein [Rhizomicrobium sp.]
MTDVRPSVFTRLARRPALSLLFLCLVIWLPGALSLPALDRDESRFAQASKQMIETGDFIDIRFSTGTRYNKPVGIYWLQAASTELLGFGARDRIWTYRVPSLAGGYLAVLLLFWCARAFVSTETALAAAALLAASVLLTAETQIATTDAVLLAATLGAQAVLFRLYLCARDPSRPPVAHRVVLAGWFAFGIGVLVKGPVILGVVGLTALAISLWDRDWRWLKATRAWQGFFIVALVVLPWLIAISLQSHGAFFKQSLGHDFGDKLVGGQESHGAPPGYYLALATLTLWPATLFVLPGLRAAWLERTSPAIRYLLAWAASSWLMFELVPTKLPHYIIPAYPALALLAACWAFDGPGNDTRLARILSTIAGFQYVIGLVAFVLAAILLPIRYGDGAWWPGIVLAIAGSAAGVIALIAYMRGARSQALLASVIAAIVFVPTLTAGIGPHLEALWVTPRAAALVAKDRRPGDPPPIIAGYVEPSLIFALGTDTRVGTGATAAQMAARQGGLSLIEDRERDAFLAGLATRDTEAFPVDTLQGYDYSHGRKVHITIYRVAAASDVPPQE